MNLLLSRGRSFTGGEEKALQTPRADGSTGFMVEDEGKVVESWPAAALSAHEDARRLVRLVQCSCCSRPFDTPVTLPCGHSLCRACLPSPHARANVSYPNTPNRQQGITCPLGGCGAEHALDECNVDVIMSKVMDSIAVEVQNQQALEELPPIHLEEKLHPQNEEYSGEKEKVPGSSALCGGRLMATFAMAANGQLDYTSEVVYQSDGSELHSQLDIQFLSRLREMTSKELDCLVCYHLMYDPVTTPCGHTFCRKCLARVLDHSRHCPLCRQTLPIPPSLEQQSSNLRLFALLKALCPETVAARRKALTGEEVRVGTGRNVPLFVCTLSFPTMPTFLHIFEPRYRLMIRRALEGDRQFGMMVYNRNAQSDGVPFLEYGTMLDIVDAQMLPDGRSFLETRGLYRFRVRSHQIVDGYFVGDIDRVEDVGLADEERLEADEVRTAQQSISSMPSATQPDADLLIASKPTQDLLLIGLVFIERMQARSAPWVSTRILAAYGPPPNDPALFPYWFAAVLPIADDEKYELLRTTSVRERLRIVIGWIREAEGQRWFSGGSSCTVL